MIVDQYLSNSDISYENNPYGSLIKISGNFYHTLIPIYIYIPTKLRYTKN